MPPQPKIDRQDVLNLLIKISKEKKEKDKILITTNSMLEHFYEKEDIQLTAPTLRKYGWHRDSWLTRKHPECFEYNTEGDKTYRGMLVNVQKVKENIGFEA